MVPELMIEGYEDIITNYNLRLDNCAMNGDNRLLLTMGAGRAYDAVCLRGGLSPAGARLRCCCAVCGYLRLRPGSHAQRDGQHECCVLKYHYSVKPFLIVPIIGGMFTDLINTGMITMFLNFFH